MRERAGNRSSPPRRSAEPICVAAAGWGLATGWGGGAAGWLAAQVNDDAAKEALAYLEYALRAPGAEDSDACFDLRGLNDPELESAMRRAFEHAQN